VTRRFLPYFLFLCIAAACAQAAAVPELTAESTDTDPQTGDQVFTGKARLEFEGAVLIGDQIRYNTEKRLAIARGHVALTREARRVLAEEIVYALDTRAYRVTRLRLGEAPLYISGDHVASEAKTILIEHANLTYHEPAPFAPTLTADTITVTLGDKVEARNAWLGLGTTPIISLGNFEQSVGDPLISHLSIKAGYKKSLGAFTDLGLRLPVSPGVKLGADLGYYTARGVLAGPAVTYKTSSPNTEDIGFLKTGYLNDQGDTKNDILNRPIQKDRGFVQWQHQRTYLDHATTLNTQLNYWSDSSVVRDFRPGDFFAVQQPDNFFEATTATDNTVSSLFVRAQPNTYYHVQQRLPEFRFDLLPTAIGNGFYERFDFNGAALRERPFTLSDGVLMTEPTIKSNRLDAFYSLTRPISPHDWLTFNPIAGARVTHYLDAVDGKSTYTRALGEVGLDASLRASGLYDYNNKRWDIDGIRHLVTPKLSYRYIPSSDKGRRYIPQIDDRVFDTALPTLELGNQRNIDDLAATHTLRLGIDNTFQTRDKTYGSRDLLTLNLAQDFRFKRQPGEKDFSAIHTGLSVMPVRWLKLDVYNSFAPQNFTARELNTRLTLHDGEAWSFSLSNHYLQHQIDEYISEGRYRINEVYQAVARLHYDARLSRFNERSIALRQNIDNIWTLQYGVSYYEGRQRESNFGFNVEVRLKGF